MNKNNLFLLSLLIFLSTFCGCFSGGMKPYTASRPGMIRYGYKTQEAPIFFVIYHPLTNFYSRPAEGATPLFDYPDKSWHAERMRRDMLAIKEAGFDVVICAINSADFSDRLQFQLETFAGICKEIPDLQFCMMLTDEGSSAKLNQFLTTLLNTSIFNQPNYFRYAVKSAVQKPLILTGTKLIRHPAVTIQRINSRNWQIAPTANPVLNQDQATLFANTHFPEEADTQFGNAFFYAIYSKPKHIIVNAWNDYQNGFILEENSRDLPLLRRAKLEIKTIKSEFAPPEEQ